MTYRGTVKDGVVVFEGQRPPEGIAVDVAESVTVTPAKDSDVLTADERARRLHENLLKLADTMKQELPTDASLNVDHYLYGHPKR